MRTLWLALIGLVVGNACSQAVNPADSEGAQDPLDYESAIHLDAESLAEIGMKVGYEDLIRKAGDIGVDWAPMREMWDGQTQGYDGGPNYRVEVNGTTYAVYREGAPYETWAIATKAFFDAVNDQLQDKPFKFYALMAGNDLHAIRLTPDEFDTATAYHAGTPDAPYVPTDQPPDYGYPAIERR